MNEEDEEKKRTLIIFGKDFAKVPCFRSSMLWAIGGGLASGLGYFMFTSKPGPAGHVAMGAYLGIATVYWIRCRYIYFNEKFQYGQIESLMNPDREIYSDSQSTIDLPTKDPLDLKTV